MSTSLITFLTFVSISLLAISLGSLVYEYFFRYRLTVRERLNEISQGECQEVSSLFKDLKRASKNDFVNRVTWRERLERTIEQAGVEWTPSSFAARCLGGGVLTALLGLWGGWWLSLIFVPFGASLPFAVLYARRKVRQRQLSRQLPEAFQMISRAVSAGQTVPSALQIIAQDFEPPVCEEFALCYEQQNLGISRESALRKLAQRTGIMELQIFVVAMLVQAKSGGDLVELLDNLSGMIRKRLKLKDRVRALTGEGRMQATVLIVLPILALLGVILLSPEYAQSLLDRPWLLAGTAAAQIVGALWVRHIVNFEY